MDSDKQWNIVEKYGTVCEDYGGGWYVITDRYKALGGKFTYSPSPEYFIAMIRAIMKSTIADIECNI